ncbi:MAG TPA: hypothetical protein VGB17_07420 [Pyrinomonadaceae bacterium]|jgi:hypothetical protein
MKAIECAKEKMVARAAVKGDWNDELLAHMASCTACQEVLQASRWMRALAEVPAAEHPLPNAAYVWWKAQLLEQQAAEERAMRPLLLAQVTAYIAVALCAAVWAIWKIPQLQHWLAASDSAMVQTSPTLNATHALPLVLLALTLLCTMAILGLRAILTED